MELGRHKPCGPHYDFSLTVALMADSLQLRRAGPFSRPYPRWKSIPLIVAAVQGNVANMEKRDLGQ